MDRYLEFIKAMQSSNRNFVSMALFSVAILVGWWSIRMMPAHWRPVATWIYLGAWLVIFIFIPVYLSN